MSIFHSARRLLAGVTTPPLLVFLDLFPLVSVEGANLGEIGPLSHPLWHDCPTFPSSPIYRIVQSLIFRANLLSDLIYLTTRHRRRTTSVRSGKPSL